MMGDLTFYDGLRNMVTAGEADSCGHERRYDLETQHEAARCQPF